MKVVENYYEILGVDKEASIAEIKTAYRKIMRDHHPDIAPGEDNVIICQKATEAMTTLTDSAKRTIYDADLKQYQERMASGNVHEDSFDDDVSDSQRNWEPSWGQSEEWEDAVVEEDDYTPPPKNDNITPPKHEPINPVYANNVPNSILQGKVSIKSRQWDALASVLIPLVSIPVSMLLFPYVGAFSTLLPLLAVGGIIFSLAKTKNSNISKPMGIYMITAIAVIVYGTLYYISTTVSKQNIAHLAIQALYPAVVTYLTASTFWRYYYERKLLKPSTLSKSNIFGGKHINAIDDMIEEEFNNLWDIPGLRVFRVKDNAAISHILAFNDKFVVVKGAHLRHPGVLRFVSNTVVNQYDEYLNEPVFGPGEDYIGDLNKFSTHAPKAAKIYPIIVGMPNQNMLSFIADKRTTFVKLKDLYPVVSQILMDGAEQNIVDHKLITSTYLAASGQSF